MTRTYRKTYTDPAVAQRAAANHRWLSDLGLRVPELLAVGHRELNFVFVSGRHARPSDLLPLALLLGEAHALAHRAELHDARLDSPWATRSGHRVPDFCESRSRVIDARLRSGLVPDPLLDMKDVSRLLSDTARSRVAFYKDTNPRNVLITPEGRPVLIDFDDLTLAPFGYDLAKLIVTLAMTYGVRPAIYEALTCYNATLADIATVSWDELMTWAEVHHILTSRYLGRSGYQHGWNRLRPQRNRR